jgi:hypothetical protein
LKQLQQQQQQQCLLSSCSLCVDLDAVHHN